MTFGAITGGVKTMARRSAKAISGDESVSAGRVCSIVILLLTLLAIAAMIAFRNTLIGVTTDAVREISAFFSRL